MIVWSNGMGVQSTAIAVLIAQGKLLCPDMVVTADTGRERAISFEWLAEVIDPLLARVGLKTVIVPHDVATVDLYGKNGDVLIPAYMANGSGKLPTFCSNEWKRRVVLRYLKAQDVTEATLWLGMSLDEAVRRMKKSDVDWITHAYPLVDLRLSRHDCILLCQRAGLPTPPRSRCWMCPQQHNADWREIRANPEEWAKATELDKQVAQSHGVYLHRDGVPLAQADLDNDGHTGQLSLLDQCADTGCWV